MVFDGSSKPTNLTPIREHQDRRDLEQFLQFTLVPDTTLMIPLSQLTEVLTIPLGQIVPIPQMPPWVMGVYNWRGEVLWMVDLGSLLGLTPWHQQAQIIPVYRAIILHSTEDLSSSLQGSRQMLGMVVTRVEDIEWLNPNEIQSPPASAVTSSFAPFLRGYWLNPQGNIIIILEGKAIFSAMKEGVSGV